MEPDVHHIVRPTIEVVLEDAGANWSAYAPGVPGCIATGRDRDEVRLNIEDALAAHFRFVAAEDAEELIALAAEVRAEIAARGRAVG